MKKFSPAQVKSAVDRLPRQSNASIDQVLVNARRFEIEPLVEASQSELRTRGSLKLSGAEAEQALEISARITGKALPEVIGWPSRKWPLNPRNF